MNDYCRRSIGAILRCCEQGINTIRQCFSYFQFHLRFIALVGQHRYAMIIIEAYCQSQSCLRRIGFGGDVHGVFASFTGSYCKMYTINGRTRRITHPMIQIPNIINEIAVDILHGKVGTDGLVIRIKYSHGTDRLVERHLPLEGNRRNFVCSII